MGMGILMAVWGLGMVPAKKQKLAPSMDAVLLALLLTSCRIFGTIALFSLESLPNLPFHLNW